MADLTPEDGMTPEDGNAGRMVGAPRTAYVQLRASY